MTEDPIQHLHREIAVFYFVEELDTLDVMEKLPDAILLAESGKAALPEMSIRNMADIMTEGNCLDKVFIKAETSSYRPRNLRNELDMDYTMGNMVVFDERENLGLIDVPRVCPCMDDSVRVT